MTVDMHLSAIVTACAVPATLLAYASRGHAPWPVVAALGYTAGVGYIFALASSDLGAQRSTGLLGKDAHGRIPLWSYVAWWPYHLGLRAKLAVGSFISSEPLYNRILDGWYLGGWPRSSSMLPADANLSVVDVTCELPRTHAHRYVLLPTWDTQVPSPELIEHGVRHALKDRELGRPVYVHCAHGHGRSAMVMLAALIETGDVSSIDDGLRLMQAVRPKVHLNERQRLGLEAWFRGRKQVLAMSPMPPAAGAGNGGSSSGSGASGKPLPGAVVSISAVEHGAAAQVLAGGGSPLAAGVGVAGLDGVVHTTPRRDSGSFGGGAYKKD